MIPRISPKIFAEAQVGDDVRLFFNDLPKSILKIDSIEFQGYEMLLWLKYTHNQIEKCCKWLWWANPQEIFAQPVGSKNGPEKIRVEILTAELFD